MAHRRVSKELWQKLQPLIPVFSPSTKGCSCTRSISDEAVFEDIFYVLQTGILWEDHPQPLGYGIGMTCWRWLRQWQAAGVWQRLHLAMLEHLREYEQIDWSRASIDGSSVRRQTL